MKALFADEPPPVSVTRAAFNSFAELLSSITFQHACTIYFVSDVLMYIYTSGTTGLPKAAVISNVRYSDMKQSIKIIVYLN